MARSLPILSIDINHFDAAVERARGELLTGLTLDTVQVNIGLRCNLACHHCHVESSPKRTEEMSRQTMLQVLDAARRCNAKALDLTGGAPEMHPHFREFVTRGRMTGLNVIVRTNLTILLKPGYTDMPEFFVEQGVHLIASLPCYLESNVDKQRGKHVYTESVQVIRRLNELGYGKDGRLKLDLVYNPRGTSLPPPQPSLEADYKRELYDRFGIVFNQLYAITNMPIGRFHRDLERAGKADGYHSKLRSAFNAGTLESLMCRHQIHVGHDGRLYDCDFNYAINLGVNGTITHISQLDPATYRTRTIATGNHCFGCTAGGGSSCKGALV